jgi:hypothetical protein
MSKDTSQDGHQLPHPSQGTPEMAGVHDGLDLLLARDAASHPVRESPWFAGRTSALARSLPQEQSRKFFSLGSFLLAGKRLRWMLPLPLAGLAALALFCSHLGLLPTSSRAFSSTESDFEQHMEMIASSDYSEDYFTASSR